MGKSLNGRELGPGIYQRKEDKLYVARYIDRFGKRKALYAKTANEITKKLRDAKYEDERQLNFADPNMKLDEWFDIWMEVFKKNCRNTSKRTYQTQYNRLRCELGWRKVSELKKVIIQNAFNKLKTDKMRRDCRALLFDMLKCAVESDMLNKNPASGIVSDINHDEKSERRVLSDEEVDALYDVCRKSGNTYRIFVLALNTGMRIGEILGLCWECVDFDNNIIHIKKTLAYLPNNGNPVYELHKPKTTAGVRSIPMTKNVKSVLLEQKMYDRVINGRHNPSNLEDLVFVSKTNHPINEANIRCSIKYYIDKVNKSYPDIHMESFTMHCLRHTYATNAIAAGMKPKVLQKILGHTSLKMTMDLYTHVREDDMRSQMELLAEMA